MKFRLLKADEIECRVSTISEKGCSLLLYKDARVDQNILDETVGALGWQRTHQLIGDRLYCTVSLWDKDTQQWICKQDVGVESYTEKEKGQASDSFKRACFNWGIGRELYTAPFIWISAGDVKIENKNGKPTTYDRFVVRSITYNDGKIDSLQIYNTKQKKVVYTFGNIPSVDYIPQIKKELERTGVAVEAILDKYGKQSLKSLTEAEQLNAYNSLKKTGDKK